MNTPFKDLYYYHFRSTSKIDNAIYKALAKKKSFSEKGFAPDFGKKKSESEKPADEVYQVFKSKNFGGSKIISMPSNAPFRSHISDYTQEYNNWEDPNNPLYKGE